MSWLLAFMAQFNTGLLTISLHFLNYYWNCLEEFLLIKNIVSLPANDQTVHNCSKILSFFLFIKLIIIYYCIKILYLFQAYQLQLHFHNLKKFI